MPEEERESAEALLAWAIDRAAKIAQDAPEGERAQIMQGLIAKNVAGRELLEAHGFEPVRYSLEMAIEFGGEPEEPEWPPGLRVRTFERGRDERDVWAVQQEAFRDSWNFHEQPYEEWAHFTLREDEFDPDLNFLALEGDELAGIALCRKDAPRRPELGWIEILGVRRPWRKHGLGLALLRHAFRELHARGKSGAGLGVDADSPTGATRLYERAGMRRVDEMAVYALTVRESRS